MANLADALIAPSPGLAEATVRDFVALLKPRVMSLVVFTAFVGLWLAPGHLHPVLAATAILCIAVAAGACGAINMWYDRDIDAVMGRTRSRPLPARRMAPDDALSFGVLLGVGSVLMMGLAVNLTAAAWLAATILFYVFVYTVWLKRRTPQNIVIGGAAGAFPPIVGWSAVTGDVSAVPMLLFALIFLWTPPHFWALSLYRAGDYERAGVPMLPVVRGPEVTRRHILGYTLLLWPVAIGPYLFHVAGFAYLAVALIDSALFTGFAVRLLIARDDGSARRMFRFSLLYLATLFAALVLDRGGQLLGG